MPLLDHFRPPLSERSVWESFHATWCSTLADHLNRNILPPGYLALAATSPSPDIEVNGKPIMATPSQPEADREDGTSGQPCTVWTPDAPPLLLPTAFPERFSVEVHSIQGGFTLVAALELVSPGNKDGAGKHRLLAAKCAAYLARGVALVLIDIVTSRSGNLHNELMDLIEPETAFHFVDLASLYTVAYRPLRRPGGDQVEAWPMPLHLGAELPEVPLSLSAGCCVAVDLEEAYRDACELCGLEEPAAPKTAEEEGVAEEPDRSAAPAGEVGSASPS